jgi:uroporphyrinogen-III synthase
MAPSGSGSGQNIPAAAAGAAEGPLNGLRILNTREAGAAAELTSRLEALGAKVLECPMLAFAPPESWEPFDTRLGELRPEDWVAFTSATAVRFTMERLASLGVPAQKLAGAHLAAIGSATATALEAQGLTVDLLPEQFQSEGLLKDLLEQLPRGGRVWLPRAAEAREALVEGLERAGIEVAVTPVYTTIMPSTGLGEAKAAMDSGGLDWIIFTSSSTVTHLIRMLSETDSETLDTMGVKIACLGSVTAETARQHGLPVSVVPTRQDLDGLLAALVGYIQQNVQRPAG